MTSLLPSIRAFAVERIKQIDEGNAYTPRQELENIVKLCDGLEKTEAFIDSVLMPEAVNGGAL